MGLVVVYLLWGSVFLFTRLLITDVPPLLAGAGRFLVGGAGLGVIVLASAGSGGFRMSARQLGTSMLAGLLLPAWGNGLVGIAQTQVPSGIAALLLAVVPLLIVLLRLAFGDRPRAATLVGVAVGMLGLATLVLAGSGSGGTSGNAWWGPWLVVLAGVGWACGTFATTRMAVPPNPYAMAAVQMFTGGVIMTVVGVVSGARLDVAAVPASTWWVWLGAALSTLGGFSGYAIALRGLPVSTVATYAYVNPVLAVVLGIVVAGERFSVLQLVGGLVVVLAVVLVVAAERRPSDLGAGEEPLPDVPPR
ncbi:drug/metabolite exporter YedA [Pseudonocardia ailaonensis]|uniref:Drug/metabolite exporter YedA n=1 Tax=Pseudonocardia ailaonensis TaxID=367279 RepID=A0ABN2MK10_9PSEU